ncbi:MAG TPA: hypothetical protein VFG54_20305 [Prolixibacteraceae bacterium]|nr:hypothetical protein [Prolixibacteraceae bacterium]
MIKIQSGPSISNLEWSIDNFVPRGNNEYLLGKSAFIGVDYLNRRYFNLSTNVGYLQKGDRSEVAYTVSEGNTMELPMMEAKFEYLSANTMAEIKYPLMRILVPYISVGPRFDFMISYPEELSFIKEIEEITPYSYGFNLGGGVKLDFRSLQLGVRSDYYLNLAKIANWVSASNSDSWIEDKTLLINFTLGYKL